MPYIGKQLVRGQNRKLDDISSGFNGSQTTFTLQIASQNVTVGSALQLWISLGGVIQEPTIDYTIAGNQITFTTAPAASLDFFGVIQGDVTDTNTPGDATVTTSKLATGLTVNLADGSAATSSLQLGGTDSGLFSSAADKVNVTTGGVERLEIGDSEVVFNDPSNDVDFRVESNGNANMLFVDGGNDRVGIGTTPGATLDIKASSSRQIRVATESSNNAGLVQCTESSGNNRDIALGGQNVTFCVGAFNTTSRSEAARIDTSGRLLVGTTSSRSVSSLNSSLQVEGTGGDSSTISVTRNVASAAPPRVVFGKSRGTSVGSSIVVQDGDSLGEISFSGADGTDANSVAATINCKVDGTPGSNDMPGRLMFSTTADGASTPTERMRIDSSGNVGINQTPTRELSLHSPNNNNALIHFTNDDTGETASDGALVGIDGNEDLLISNQEASKNIRIFNNGAERCRIDSSGRLLLDTTSNYDTNYKVSLNMVNTGGIIYRMDGSGTRQPARFTNSSGTVVGSISTTTTATTYNTSSDYRLKENVVDIADGITRVKQLQPKRFNFIADADTTVDGFLAHEAQTVVPEAVTGTHNGVQVWKEGEELPEGVSFGDNKLDEDGNTIPEYQGIDPAKLVPLLTAALQEAITKIETLETKVAALEAE